MVVAPATADLMAKLANGLANDLASAVLLATDKPVLMAPAMNPKMWAHPATRRNRAALEEDGVRFVGPERGEMAERGEAGEGRMAEPLEIVAAIEALLDAGAEPACRPRASSSPPARPMSRSTRCATSPTVRRASRAMRSPRHSPGLAPTCTLVSGPVGDCRPRRRDDRPCRDGARDARRRSRRLCPPTPRSCVAAVADWRPEGEAGAKIKKAARQRRRRAATWSRTRISWPGVGHQAAPALSGGRLRRRDPGPARAMPRPSWPARAPTSSSPTMSAEAA